MKLQHLITVLSNIYVWIGAMILQIIQPIDAFITKYIFADKGFLKWLIIAMTIDLITGIAKAYVKKEAITSKGLRDTISKVTQYGALLIITHVLTHYEIGGTPVTNTLWINKLVMEFILIIECKSVYENIVEINPAFDFVTSMWKKIIKTFPIKEENK